MYKNRKKSKQSARTANTISLYGFLRILFHVEVKYLKNHILASLNTSMMEGYVFRRKGGRLDFATQAALVMSSSF